MQLEMRRETTLGTVTLPEGDGEEENAMLTILKVLERASSRDLEFTEMRGVAQGGKTYRVVTTVELVPVEESP